MLCLSVIGGKTRRRRLDRDAVYILTLIIHVSCL